LLSESMVALRVAAQAGLRLRYDLKSSRGKAVL
jgi:hypothetical protein